MGYIKPKNVTETELSVASLPNHGTTYTVIPHSSIIKYTEDLLNQNGFNFSLDYSRGASTSDEWGVDGRRSNSPQVIRVAPLE